MPSCCTGARGDGSVRILDAPVLVQDGACCISVTFRRARGVSAGGAMRTVSAWSTRDRIRIVGSAVRDCAGDDVCSGGAVVFSDGAVFVSTGEDFHNAGLDFHNTAMDFRCTGADFHSSREVIFSTRADFHSTVMDFRCSREDFHNSSTNPCAFAAHGLRRGGAAPGVRPPTSQ